LNIPARRFAADGTALGAEFRVNTTEAGDQGAPKVTGLTDGGFVVSWTNPGTDGPDIHAQRYAADGTAAGGEFRVNAATAGDQHGPTVTALGGGGFVVAWVGSDLPGATGFDVFARRYAADGTALAGEFRVNTDARADQWGAADVTDLADGGFLVSWSGVGTDGADIYARRYTADGAAAGEEFRVNATAAGYQYGPAVTGLASGGFAVAWSDETEVGAGVAAEVYARRFTLEEAPADAVPVRGTDGDDVFAGRPGRFAYEGLQGRDVLDWSGIGFRSVVVTAQADGGVRLTHGNDVASVRGVEEIRFADGRLVLDAADPAAKVARLYEAALDRLPDQSGMNFWTAAVQNGEPLSSLASGFLSAPEFTARFGDIADDGAFVDRLYLNVLGRAGEADGRKFWVDSLGGGATRAEVLAAFSESQENQAGTAALVQNGIWDRNEAAAEVARLYDTVFGRRPDLEGLTFWKGALEDGAATLGRMADAFTGSAEFRAQYGNLGNRDFADALYVNTLDRPADQAGLDFWTGRLDAGVARSEVVLAFSESAEHIALTAPAIGGEARGEHGILFA
jgi:hypothetical protein